MVAEDNPVRDLILVENECFRATGRAVRYAALAENGFSNHLMSLTGHFARRVTPCFYQYFVPDGTDYNAIHNGCI
jgi:hypothetical protein